MHGVKSPSKYMTIGQMEEIQNNNYLSSDVCVDYAADELDAELWAKRERKAQRDTAAMLDFAAADTAVRAPRVIVMPPLPAPMPPMIESEWSLEWFLKAPLQDLL